MGGSVLYPPHSLLHLPSFSTTPRSRNPFFSVQVIAAADKPFISTIKADGNRERPPHKNSSPPKAEGHEDTPQPSDARSSLSPNKQEILALFKRIQSSISKGDNLNPKKRNSKAAEDNKPSAESILEVLHHSRTRGKGKTTGRKGDKTPAPQKDSVKKVEKAEHLSMAGLGNSRPPSSFTRRSPIPSLSSPRDEVQPINETLPAKDAVSDHLSMKFEEMKLPQLKEVAKSKGIKGYSKLKKSELVELLIRSGVDFSL